MLVVVTNRGIQFRRDEITNIKPVGIQCATLVIPVQWLLGITNWKQGIGIEVPVIGNSFCIDSNLLEGFNPDQ